MSNSHTFATVEHKKPVHKRGQEVKTYTEDTQLRYPFLLLKTESLLSYQVEILQAMLSPKTLVEEVLTYNVYVNLKGNIIGIGVIIDSDLKKIVKNKIFDHFEKEMHLQENLVYTGDMILALCPYQG